MLIQSQVSAHGQPGVTSEQAIQAIQQIFMPETFGITYRDGLEQHTYNFTTSQYQIDQAYAIAEGIVKAGNANFDVRDVDRLMNSRLGYKICQKVHMSLHDTPQQRAVVIDKPHDGKSEQHSYQSGRLIGVHREKIPRTPFLQRVIERGLLALSI